MTESEAKRVILGLVGPPWTEADIHLRPMTGSNVAFVIEPVFGPVGAVTHDGALIELFDPGSGLSQKELYQRALSLYLAFRGLESPSQRRCRELEQALKESEAREIEAKGQLFDLAKACLEWKGLYQRAVGCATTAVDKYMSVVNPFQEISAEIGRLRTEVKAMLEKNPLANGM